MFDRLKRALLALLLRLRPDWFELQCDCCGAIVHPRAAEAHLKYFHPEKVQ